MKRKTKLLSFASFGVATTISLPFFIVSSPNKNTNEKKEYLSDEMFEKIARSGIPYLNLDSGYEDDIWVKQKKEILKEIFNGWKPHYSVRDFSSYDIRQKFIDASINGWPNVKEWQYYVQAYSEFYGAIDIRNKFGAISGQSPETDWIAWHFAPGSKLNFSYHDSGSSEVSPTWDNAENDSWNNIDNSISWYMYKSDDLFQFLFDQNNIDNAFKRMIFEGVLVPVSRKNIIHEQSDDGLDINRNYYMVDGQLTKNLQEDLDYYYVRDNVTNDEYVRDDHGWKVIISNRDIAKSFTDILNPSDLANNNLFVANNNHDLNPRKVIAYPGDYSYFQKYITKNVLSSDIRQFQKSGRYTLTIKESSFTALRKNKNVLLSYQNSNSNRKTERFGQILGDDNKFYSPWLSGQYSWEWVEDGNGGYKIWKNLDKIMPVLKSYLYNHSVNPGDNPRFYGNFRRIFPVKEWFVNEPNFFDTKGF